MMELAAVFFMAAPPSSFDGSPRTLPSGTDEAGGTAVKFYELWDNLEPPAVRAFTLLGLRGNCRSLAEVRQPRSDRRARTHRLTLLAAIGYGTLELVEGVGLWLDQLWAEYLTVIATSLFIPFELYELVIRPSLGKAGGILINVLIVLYLARALRRRLTAAKC